MMRCKMMSNFLLLYVTFIATYIYQKEHKLEKSDTLPWPNKSSPEKPEYGHAGIRWKYHQEILI